MDLRSVFSIQFLTSFLNPLDFSPDPQGTFSSWIWVMRMKRSSKMPPGGDADESMKMGSA